MRKESNIGSTNIKIIIRGYYKRLHVHKFNHLDKMNKLIERHRVTKFTQEGRDKLNIKKLTF